MMPSADAALRSRPLARAAVSTDDWQRIGDWQAACSTPGEHVDASALDGLDWIAAAVPGTAAAAMAAAGRWSVSEPLDFDAGDWWFRTGLQAGAAPAGEELVLHLGGIATVWEAYLNGELIASGESMFEQHAIDVSALLQGANELAICCRALVPLLAAQRRPRARWRTRLVAGGLRFYRTMLLGRAPGFAPGPAAVGPWREVALQHRRALAVESLELRPRLEGGDGVLSLSALLRTLGGAGLASAELELDGPTGSHRAPLALAPCPEQPGAVRAEAELRVPDVAQWWPHTHGEPALYAVRVRVDRDGSEPVEVDAGRTGFRALAFADAPGHELERDGLQVHVNGVPVFARGAVWTPVDFVGLAPSEEELRRAIEQAREAGMNMLRLPGTGAYESQAFHDLCDEAGMLVWQDLMFANLDYPLADEAFRATVEREVSALAKALAGRPSVAVICGNSEVEQQVAMLGLEPALGRGELFGELIPALITAGGLDAVYVPSAPCGDGLPFRPDSGVANYYGVGGYRRPLEDARRADVRFAAECLAFANVPDESTIERMVPAGAPALPVHHPLWKAGVPRDVGSGWDFEDVRDHYLALLFGLEAAELRRVDHERYMELSRAVTGEVMAEVYGEWRRERSNCAGALVLWLRDLRAGAGWGLVDDAGAAKVAYHHLRRALAPVAVWTVDEGLGGVVAHVANDRPQPLSASLRVALYTGREVLVGEQRADVRLAGHSQGGWNVESVLGRFLDAAWAYRFGPPAQDVIAVSLEAGEGGELLSQAFRFPAGRPCERESADSLGLAARFETSASGGGTVVRLSSRRLAYGVRLHVEGYDPGDCAFSIEPGRERFVALRAAGAEPPGAVRGHLTALNLSGRVPIAAPA